MKQKKTLLLLASSLLLLGSCALGNNTNDLTGGEMDASTYEAIVAKNGNPISTSTPSVTQMNCNDKFTVVNSSYASQGLLVTKNSEGYIGFYSLHYGKYLIAPSMSPLYLKYTVSTSNYFGYRLAITYKENTGLIDALGNVLIQGSKGTTGYQYKALSDSFVTSVTNFIDLTSGSSYYAYEYFTGKNYYLTLSTTTKMSASSGYVYHYQADGTLTNEPKADYTGYEEADGEDNPEISDPAIGSYFDDDLGFSLKAVGMTDCSLIYIGNHYIVHSKTDGVLATFDIPSDAYGLSLFDKSLVYQLSSLLPADSTDYAYSNAGNKYSLLTYRVDLSTGSTTSINFSYKVFSVGSIKNADGIYVYGYPTVYEIRDDKTLSSFTRRLLIDKDAKVLVAKQGLGLFTYTRLDDTHFYDTNTKIIYDANVKPIVFLSGYSSFTFNYESKLIAIKKDDKWGAIDYDGLIAVPFEYDSIVSRFVDGKAFATLNGDYFKVTSGSNSKSALKTPVAYSDEVFVFPVSGTTTQYEIQTPSTTFSTSWRPSTSGTYSCYWGSLSGSNAAYLPRFRYLTLTIDDSLDSFSGTYYFSFSNKGMPNTSTFAPLQAENTSLIHDGSTSKNGLIVKEGTNTLYRPLTSLNTLYLSFTPTADSCYVLDAESSSYSGFTFLEMGTLDDGTLTESTAETISSSGTFSYSLKSGITYSFRISGVSAISTNESTFTVTISKGTGQYSATPLYISYAGTSTLSLSRVGGNFTLYLLFSPKNAGTYTFTFGTTSFSSAYFYRLTNGATTFVGSATISTQQAYDGFFIDGDYLIVLNFASSAINNPISLAITNTNYAMVEVDPDLGTSTDIVLPTYSGVGVAYKTAKISTRLNEVSFSARTSSVTASLFDSKGTLIKGVTASVSAFTFLTSNYYNDAIYYLQFDLNSGDTGQTVTLFDGYHRVYKDISSFGGYGVTPTVGTTFGFRYVNSNVDTGDRDITFAVVNTGTTYYSTLRIYDIADDTVTKYTSSARGTSTYSGTVNLTKGSTYYIEVTLYCLAAGSSFTITLG